MVKIFMDGASLPDMIKLNGDSHVSGFTTNPTLMKKAGVTDYKEFAKSVLKEISIKPVSFEVFGDNYDEMYRQAMEISGWGNNVYVKIPVSNTSGNLNYRLMNDLAVKGVKINGTAIMTYEQILSVINVLGSHAPSIISVFAGRIADTGVDPVPFMNCAVYSKRENQEILWASTREAFNYTQALNEGVDIITMSPDIYKKVIIMQGTSLKYLSLETVRMFYNDAESSGYKL